MITKPFPRGEGAELCSADEVERPRFPPAAQVMRRTSDDTSSVTAQSAAPPSLTQGRHRRTAMFSPCGHSTVWRCLPLKGDGLKSPQQISRKRKTPLPERTNRQGRFHRRNGVGKRNYHVAWGRDCVFCQRAERLVCGHENSRLLSDSAHYIMPLWISKANVSDS